MGHFWILLVSVIIWHTIHSERTVLQDDGKEKRMNVRFSKTSTETLTTGKPRSNSTAPFVTPTLETRTIMAQNSTENISKSEECLTMKLVNVAFSAGFTIFGITGNTISIRILHKLRTKNSSSFTPVCVGYMGFLNVGHKIQYYYHALFGLLHHTYISAVCWNIHICVWIPLLSSS